MFTLQTAEEKVKKAQDLWNTRDPERVVLAYTDDSTWRNRDEFLKGHDEIKAFLKRKWAREQQYKLKKELFCFMDNKIAVQFWYEYYNEGWHRCYGIEHWTFAEDGRMHTRMMSGNEIDIQERTL